MAYPHHILHKYQASTASAWPGKADMVFGKDPFRPPLTSRPRRPRARSGGDILPMSSSSSAPHSFFAASLSEAAPEIANAISGELGRQRHEIELLASENIVSRAVLEAQGSVMTNKYAEGYPGARYY